MWTLTKVAWFSGREIAGAAVLALERPGRRRPDGPRTEAGTVAAAGWRGMIAADLSD